MQIQDLKQKLDIGVVVNGKMQGEFKILINNQIQTFVNYNDIPLKFTNLISFKPYYPPGPHTPEQHKEIEKYSFYLNALLRREDAGSN